MHLWILLWFTHSMSQRQIYINLKDFFFYCWPNIELVYDNSKVPRSFFFSSWRLAWSVKGSYVTSLIDLCFEAIYLYLSYPLSLYIIMCYIIQKCWSMSFVFQSGNPGEGFWILNTFLFSLISTFYFILCSRKTIWNTQYSSWNFILHS